MKNGASLPEATNRDHELALLLDELTSRARRGEAVHIEKEATARPELADELRRLWGAVMLADALGSHLTQAGAALDLPTAAPPEHPSWNSLPLPYRLGDYELLEEIGHGGMGVVYRARQISLGREVAVKMVLRGPLASEADLARFRAEAEAVARLDPPGIVPVYEVGETEGRAFFSMKYVSGRTLSQVLSDGPLPPRDAARLLHEVCRAVHYAHQQGVLHRDLKPSNILIDEEGRPHVSDFGLAKQVTDAASLTKTGAVLGTPAYMAPEQAAGNRGQVGPASDVYSLGTILYHMLTGRPPFQAASPVDTVLLVLEQDPPPPRLLNPKADRDLEMIALHCLQKPPDLRYATAAALADDLQAYLNDESIAARSGRFGQVVSRWFRETHHAILLENWGLLWMWHSLVLFTVCLATNLLYWLGFTRQSDRWYYAALWLAALWTWAAVFWALRRRMGPVTFVERQIAHVWAASMMCITLLFPLEYWLAMPVLRLSPVLGLVSGMVFMVKAGILSGQFYIQALALYFTAGLMAWQPDYAHLIFGVVSAACFFFPGLKYYLQRMRANGKERHGWD
jgi:serine/threonine-protein kinase